MRISPDLDGRRPPLILREPRCGLANAQGKISSSSSSPHHFRTKNCFETLSPQMHRSTVAQSLRKSFPLALLLPIPPPCPGKPPRPTTEARVEAVGHRPVRIATNSIYDAIPVAASDWAPLNKLQGDISMPEGAGHHTRLDKALVSARRVLG